MNQQLQNNLAELEQNVQRNTPVVEERLRKAGFPIEPELVRAMAKYWEILEKLSAE